MSVTAAFLLLAVGCRGGDRATGPEATEATTLEMGPTSVAMMPGDTAQLEATPVDGGGNPVSGYEVSWSSGDTAVATVDGDGTVTAVASGSTEVTATAEKTNQGQGADNGQGKKKGLEKHSDVTVGDTTTSSGSGLITNLEPAAYEKDTLETGDSVYVDRAYTIQDVPSGYGGWRYVRTANDDKDATSDSAVAFTLTDTARVALAYDVRATTLPDWLQDWTATGDTLRTTDIAHRVYTRVFAPGEVVLGGNLSGGAQGAQSMYVLSATRTSSEPDDGDDDGSDTTSTEEVTIPSEGDWTSQGTVLSPGGSGAWDSRFPHGTPGPVLKKGDTYFLYYIGADGNRSSDGGPAHRAVGLATAPSLSGPWSKHSSNPVIPWSDLQNNGDEEEGAWRVAGEVERDGTVVLLVSDLVGSGGSVNGDVRLFTSSDGMKFTDRGIILDHADSSVWGYGDELAPLGAWEADDGTKHILYVAKGANTKWGLGHAWGSSWSSVSDNTEAVTETDRFGHGTDPIEKSDTELVMFFGDNGGNFWAYTAPRSDPGNFSSKKITYSGLSSDQFAIALDRDLGKWFGFFTAGPQGDSDSVNLYTAPARP